MKTNLKMKNEGTPVDLSASDYNVFVDGLRFTIDDSVKFDSLEAWQAIDSGEFVTTSVVAPDADSQESDRETEFVDQASGDYHPGPNAKALALMPEGDNAGPYRLGDEIIGLLPSYSAGRD